MLFYGLLALEEEGAVFTQKLGTSYPRTQCHIPEEWNPEEL